MSDRKYSVGIVGLGNIGFAYDLESPSSIRTHARAAASHASTELVWGVDIDPATRSGFESEYGVATFDNASAAISTKPVDILIVAVSVEHRAELWPLLRQSKPELVISEKPLGASIEESTAVANACVAAGIGLLVNYPRRYTQATQRAKNLISAGDLGKFETGHVWYGRGVANNASHLINMLIHVLGAPWEVDYVTNRKTEYPNGDVDTSFVLSNADSNLVFTPTDSTNFSLAEVDLVFGQGRLRFVDHGYSLIEQVGLVSSSFAGYTELPAESVNTGTGIDHYQMAVMTYAVEQLANSDGFVHDVSDALSTAAIIDQVINEAK
jgi:predicted dehydrogenase